MNKFTIEADGEKIEVELRSNMQTRGGTTNLIFHTENYGAYTVAYNNDAERIYNVLHKAYEQLRIEHEALLEERDDFERTSEFWRTSYQAVQAAPRPRKIVQVSVNDDVGLHALCDDGTVWAFYGSKWHQLPPIPQEDTTKPEGEV
jgi:hypothetical protein